MTSNESSMRRFLLLRSEDVSGTSGVGIVAEGVEFSNGQVVMHWISQLDAVSVYANVRTVTSIHGHGGRTIVHWVDEEDEDYCPLEWEEEELDEEDEDVWDDDAEEAQIIG